MANLLGQILSPDSYDIEFHTYATNTMEGELEHICQKIHLEIAISSKILTNQRRTRLNYTGEVLMSDFDLAPLAVAQPFGIG